MSNNIDGKVIVITGASSGLGECTASSLSAKGSTVVLGARRVEWLEKLVQEIESAGGKAIALATDVTDKIQVEKLLKAAVEAFGRVDVLINNAGLMQ